MPLVKQNVMKFEVFILGGQRNDQIVLGYLKQHCCMGITLLTKEITPKNIFYRNEIQYRDDVPTKRNVGM